LDRVSIDGFAFVALGDDATMLQTGQTRTAQCIFKEYRESYTDCGFRLPAKSQFHTVTLAGEEANL
jgi:hypothetical protein